MEENRSWVYKTWISITAFFTVLFMGVGDAGYRGVSEEGDKNTK